MTEVIKLKRRTTGSALVIGTVPLTTGVGGIAAGEAVWDSIASIFYIGAGDDGSGNSTSIATIGGPGAFVLSALLGVANGVATLNSSGQLTASQLPPSVVGALSYQGSWNANTNSPTLVSSTGTKGWYYKVGTAGTTTLDGISSWGVGDIVAFDGTTWDKFDGQAVEVISVAGRTGVVTIASTDITDATTIGKSVLTASSLAALRVILGIDQRTGVADVAHTMAATEHSIAYTSISTVRVVSMVAASAFNAGEKIAIADWSGSCTGSIYIACTPNGSDTINGVNAAVDITNAFGLYEFESDGVSAWLIVDQLPASLPTTIDGGAI